MPEKREKPKPCPSYEDRYLISDDGRVISISSGLVRAVQKDRDGYPRVMLYAAPRRPVFAAVHRLVLLAFVGPAPDGSEAAHLNGVKTDNRIANLRWVTKQTNEDHKAIHGTRPYGESVGSSKLTQNAVDEIRALRHSGMKLSDLGKSFGVTDSAICAIVKGRSWKAVAAWNRRTP